MELRIKERIGLRSIFTEYLQVIFHTYLYHRHLYPLESFTLMKKYSIPVRICSNREVGHYICQLSEAIVDILSEKQNIIIEINSKISNKKIEKFNIKLSIIDNLEKNESDSFFEIEEGLRSSLTKLSEKLNSLPSLNSLYTAITCHNTSKLSQKTITPTSFPSWSISLLASIETYSIFLEKRKLKTKPFWSASNNGDKPHKIIASKQSHSSSEASDTTNEKLSRKSFKETQILSIHLKHLIMGASITKINCQL